MERRNQAALDRRLDCGVQIKVSYIRSRNGRSLFIGQRPGACYGSEPARILDERNQTTFGGGGENDRSDRTGKPHLHPRVTALILFPMRMRRTLA